jgi:hypothetical protein
MPVVVSEILQNHKPPPSPLLALLVTSAKIMRSRLHGEFPLSALCEVALASKMKRNDRLGYIKPDEAAPLTR